jgi:hypothetical protein
LSEKVLNLVGATKTLLAYMEESPVFDKLADAGCGGVDAYRSERFDELIGHVSQAIAAVEREISQVGELGSWPGANG